MTVDELFEIEDRINVDNFTYEGSNIWPIFRNIIGWNLSFKNNNKNNNLLPSQKLNKIALIKDLISSFFHVFKLFKRYDYIFFTTVDDYKEVDGYNRNRLMYRLTNELPNSKILEIQTGGNIKKDKKITNISYMSNTVLLVLAHLISKLILIKSCMNIREQLKKTDMDLDDGNIIKKYLVKYFFYKIIFKFTKPKKIFVTCYSFMPAIKVANDLNIDTIEFQHGSIVNHFAYSVKKDIDKSFYPKYLLVFGKQEKEYLKKMFYVENKNVLGVGNMLTNYYSQNKNKIILALKEEYISVVAVSLQSTVIEEMVEYVLFQAKKNKNICFVLIPRTNYELSKFNINEENIKVYNGTNCYEIVANSDYHLTCYSSCASEAPSLGTKNIFLNINGLSEEYFKEYIDRYDFNQLINIEQDICETYDFNKSYNKNEIIEKNYDYIYPNYDTNIRLAVNKIEGNNQ